MDEDPVENLREALRRYREARWAPWSPVCALSQEDRQAMAEWFANWLRQTNDISETRPE